MVKNLGDEEEVLDILKVFVSGVEVLVAKDIISKDTDCGHKSLSPCFISLFILSRTFHCPKKGPIPLSDVAYVLERWSCELRWVDLD